MSDAARRNTAYRSGIGNVNEHKFIRWGTSVNSTISTANQGYPLSFKFSDLINSSDFTTLYDRYRIDLVCIEFQLMTNPDSSYGFNAATANGANFYPKLWYKQDYDDDSTPTLAEIKQNSLTKCAVMEPNKIIRVFCKPAILAQTYRTTTTTGYAPQWGVWIDMAQTDVPHYGVKWVMETNNVTPSTLFTYNYSVKYFFTCKDVR